MTRGRAARARGAVLFGATLAACGAAETVPPTVTDASTWVAVGTASPDSNGETPEWRVSWQDGETGLALEATASPFACFQLDELADDAGHVFVGPPEWGPFCDNCEERVSAAAGGGLFVLPSRAGAFRPSKSLGFRFGLRDCDTLTEVDPASPSVTLTVRAKPLFSTPSRGVVPLRLFVTPASVFYDASASPSLEGVLGAIAAELSPAHLTTQMVEVVRLPAGAPSDAAFSRADPSALSALLPKKTSGAPAVPVVLAGCLRLSDSVLGTVTEPEGYTPHIPGGAGPADAVFIHGSVCGAPTPVPVAWSATALARVAAHEIGHYLGLYHSVEADGTTDRLDDTDQNNLMYFRPSDATSTGLSAEQREVLRRHPVVASE
ncbi:MAG TPA: hypothetical protein VF395_10875 [Polyangiaceae bacterium]